MSMVRTAVIFVYCASATWGAGGPSAGEQDRVSPAGLMDALEADIRALPVPPETLVQHAEAVRTALLELEQRAAAAEKASAFAYARMASYTGAMLSREQKKVTTSSRLIEITKRTGRSGEVERYQDRHKMLLATIERMSRHYDQVIEQLAALDPVLVEAGFRAHEEFLIEEGLAEQILVQQKVEEHVRARRSTGVSHLDEWIMELSSL
jgi:hypothetical protein